MMNTAILVRQHFQVLYQLLGYAFRAPIQYTRIQTRAMLKFQNTYIIYALNETTNCSENSFRILL